jgi:hypothetical protein
MLQAFLLAEKQGQEGIQTLSGGGLSSPVAASCPGTEIVHPLWPFLNRRLESMILHNPVR